MSFSVCVLIPATTYSEEISIQDTIQPHQFGMLFYTNPPKEGRALYSKGKILQLCDFLPNEHRIQYIKKVFGGFVFAARIPG